MRSSRADGRRLAGALLLGACLLLREGLRPAPAAAAAPVVAGPAPETVRPPVEVNSQSVIRKIRFHFNGAHQIDAAELKRHLTLIARQPVSGFRRALSYLPFVNDAGAPGLVPLELQRDIIRMRGLYRDAGFPHATISYQVSPSGNRPNTFDIDFDIAEGAPVLVGSVAFTDSAGGPLNPPAPLRAGYEDRLRLARRLVGTRLSAATLSRLEGRMAGWWRDRGYPLAEARAAVEVDSAGDRADLRLAMTPGPPARVSEVRVEGLVALHPNVIRREMPFRPGDVYSARKLTEGQRELQGLPIIRLALIGVPDSAVVDSGVVVLARVTEGKPRLLSGELGYITEGGLQAQLSASHNNFLGGARSLTLAGVARPGTLALEPGTFTAAVDPERLFRASLSLQQPYVFDPRLSLVGGPFAEYRDDLTGRSRLYGVNGTLIFSLAPLRNVALQYEVSRKRILEFSESDLLSSGVDQVTRVGLSPRINLARLGLTATAGVLDNSANPRRGLVVRPSLSLTLPAGMNSNEYGRLDATATGFYPLGRRVGLMMRVSGGRLFPFGRSLPGPGEDGYPIYLGFRDAAFTAGGADDVRGWGNRLLGPKYPDVRFRAGPVDSAGRSTIVPYAIGGYVPLGGLGRVSGSFEMRLPFPGLGPDLGTFAFVDAGRVWTDDLRFSGPDLGVQQQNLFWAAGAGFDWKTLVGAVRFLVGYKLNPSLLDLTDARDVFQAIQDDRPLDDLPRHPGQRWQFHLSIGTGF